jgi:hypothetical protein
MIKLIIMGIVPTLRGLTRANRPRLMQKMSRISINCLICDFFLFFLFIWLIDQHSFFISLLFESLLYKTFNVQIGII